MPTINIKKFSSPDEKRPFHDHGHVDILSFPQGTVGRAVFEPGWKWQEDVRPLAGTESCEVAHSCYVVSGRMHLVADDGQEADVGQGDVFYLEPGHDGWVIGDEPCIVLDFEGMEHYAKHEGAPERTEAHPSV